VEQRTLDKPFVGVVWLDRMRDDVGSYDRRHGWVSWPALCLGFDERLGDGAGQEPIDRAMTTVIKKIGTTGADRESTNRTNINLIICLTP
jgi:hypothetical protein